jgi:hypothetical protein
VDNPPTQRYAAAAAASRSTLGYAQGRAVSQRVRKPVTAVFRDEGRSVSSALAVTKRPVEDEEMLGNTRDVVERLRVQDLGLFEGDGDEGLVVSLDVVDDDFADFQLPLPE